MCCIKKLCCILGAGAMVDRGSAATANSLFFHGPEQIAFSEEHHNITDGQRWEAMYTFHDALTIMANRKASHGPAVDFNTGLWSHNVLATKEFGSDLFPSNLHFATFGRLSFKVDGAWHNCSNMRIGQGHYGVFTNNWWIASTECRKTEQYPLLLFCSCGVRFLAVDDANHFVVEAPSMANAISVGSSVARNKLVFSGTEQIAFSEEHHNITDGQRWEAMYTFHDALTIMANRKASHGPAVDFNTGLWSHNVLATKEFGSDLFPSNLHFATFGTLSFKVDGAWHNCSNMRIGQGHYGVFTNNWWIASTECRKTEQYPLVLFCSCGVRFLAVDDANHFVVAALNMSSDAISVGTDSKKEFEHSPNGWAMFSAGSESLLI